MRRLPLRLFLAIYCIVAHSNPQPYNARPKIEDVRAKDHKIKNEDWQKSKLGFLRYLATLYFYPANYHFYFLARDFETGYDLARILFKGDKILERIHLVSASRISIKNPNLWNYLDAEGINNEDPNRIHMMVDTGMLGTIPDHIIETAPKELKGKIKAAHLLSANRAYTNSRSYLSTVNPKAIRGGAKEWEPIILIFENFPHFNWRTTHYLEQNGDWLAMGEPSYKPPGMSMGGSDFGFGGGPLEEVEPRDIQGARIYMADTKAYGENPASKEEIKTLATLWRNLGIAYRNAVLKQDPSLFENEISKLNRNKKVDPLLARAITLDAYEIIQRHSPYGKMPLPPKTNKKTKNPGACKNRLA